MVVGPIGPVVPSPVGQELRPVPALTHVHYGPEKIVAVPLNATATRLNARVNGVIGAVVQPRVELEPRLVLVHLAYLARDPQLRLVTQVHAVVLMVGGATGAHAHLNVDLTAVLRPVVAPTLFRVVVDCFVILHCPQITKYRLDLVVAHVQLMEAGVPGVTAMLLVAPDHKFEAVIALHPNMVVLSAILHCLLIINFNHDRAMASVVQWMVLGVHGVYAVVDKTKPELAPTLPLKMEVHPVMEPLCDLVSVCNPAGLVGVLVNLLVLMLHNVYVSVNVITLPLSLTVLAVLVPQARHALLLNVILVQILHV